MLHIYLYNLYVLACMWLLYGYLISLSISLSLVYSDKISYSSSGVSFRRWDQTMNYLYIYL